MCIVQLTPKVFNRQLHLFAHLASLPTPLIAPQSFISLLPSFVSVLDEPGVRANRGDEAVRIIVEALLRMQGERIQDSQVEPLLEAIRSYLPGRKLDRALFTEEKHNEQFEDVREEPLLCICSCRLTGTRAAT
jgi:nuclear cap-binding protein subunit 1